MTDYRLVTEIHGVFGSLTGAIHNLRICTPSLESSDMRYATQYISEYQYF